MTNTYFEDATQVTAPSGDEAIGVTIDPTGSPSDGYVTPDTLSYYINPSYQLAVSVAASDLTVALKNGAGNNPSAAAPVKYKIGTTVRTVSAALSVTKNDGTNWFDAGSSELATQEVGYFVYLGYNATDGVTIGFARVPYGNYYGDFSATTTNQAYCAISTITNATSTDPYVCIGYFHAILSAGAGYTWSLPGTAVTIHHPIYTSYWLDYTPTRTGYSADPTNTVYQYRVDYKTASIVGRDGTAGTSNATTNYLTVPFTALSTANVVYQFVSACTDSGTSLTTPSYGAIYGSGPDWKTIVIGKDFSFNATGWTGSGNKQVRTITGFYPIA